jgi:hypothetical protein
MIVLILIMKKNNNNQYTAGPRGPRNSRKSEATRFGFQKGHRPRGLSRLQNSSQKGPYRYNLPKSFCNSAQDVPLNISL